MLYTLEGDGLAQMFKLNGGAKGTELPGAPLGGFVFIDVTLPKDATAAEGAQASLRHRAWRSRRRQTRPATAIRRQRRRRS